VFGLRVFEKRRLHPSSRHHESEEWQVLYRLEKKLVWTVLVATGR
jgi:hypothetical protein